MRYLIAIIALLFTVPALAQSYANEAAIVTSNFNVNDDMAALSGATPGTAVDEAKFRGDCMPSHDNWDDPALLPGLQGGSPHPHQFYGNTSTNYASTYSSLRQSGNGTCSGRRINRSAYWLPEIYKDATHIKKPDYVVLYYVNGTDGLPGGSKAAYFNSVRLPRGLEMVAGFKPGAPTYYVSPPGVSDTNGGVFTGFSGFSGWSCSSGGSAYPDLTNVALNCAVGDQLRADIVFPACWDGVNITSSDQRRHVVFPVHNNSYGFNVCPTSHPYTIPTITIRVLYSHNGQSDYSQWYLGSDRQDANPANWTANGASYHADYIMAWDWDVVETFMAKCNGVATPDYTADKHDCGTDNIGDGRKLMAPVGSDASATTDATNLIAVPTRYAVISARIRMKFRSR